MKPKSSTLPSLVVNDTTVEIKSSKNQTELYREITNKKIRELGEKFYQTKAFLERLDLNRKNLIGFAEYLAQKYQDKLMSKKLPPQTKRMKEALYCWYVEHFYDEMLDFRSSFFEDLRVFKLLPKEEKKEKKRKKKEIIFNLKNDEKQDWFKIDDLNDDNMFDYSDIDDINQEDFDIFG